MLSYNKIYIIGIGGVSLSALAVILKNQGFQIKGSDTSNGENISRLREKGFDVRIGHSKDFVLWADCIVPSSAVDDKDEDILLAKKLGKKILSRGELLGEISRLYKTISIAGCHGKTTSTGMISSVLMCANQNPTIHIGGILSQINDNVKIGKGDIFVTEACEYKDNFLSLSSFVGVILNISADHLDYFHNIENIKKSFGKFANNVDKNGFLILNADDENCMQIHPHSSPKIITFGIENKCDFRAENINEYSAGLFAFECNINGKNTLFKLPVYGFHNIFNALSAIATCSCLGVENKFIQEGIQNFQGISRRFERVFQDKNKIVIHDYAHHPEEIKAGILAGKHLNKDKIIAIFQPHTFTRTRDFFEGFCESLALADEVWLLPIYPAREKPIRGVSSYKIYQYLHKKGVNTRYFHDFSQVFCHIKQNSKSCLFLILGAGDIDKLANMFKY